MEDMSTHAALTRALVHEVLRTAFQLQRRSRVVPNALPDDAFGEEDNAAVVIDMVVGSCITAVDAAGETTAQAALELTEAILEQFVGDRAAAAELATERERNGRGSH
jgi:hypothetical protein